MSDNRKWRIVNICLCLASALSSPILAEQLRSDGADWSSPTVMSIAIIVIGTAIGVRFILGISIKNEGGSNIAHPSIDRSPYFGGSTQTFYIGSLVFISFGIGGLIFSSFSSPFSWEWLLSFCFGVGAYIGVKMSLPSKATKGA